MASHQTKEARSQVQQMHTQHRAQRPSETQAKEVTSTAENRMSLNAFSKFFCVLMSVILVIGLFPGLNYSTAYADEGDNDTGTNEDTPAFVDRDESDDAIQVLDDAENAVAEINGVTYPSVADALEAATDGDTITLLCDWAENVTIDAQNVTLDLGGYTLAASSGYTLTVSGGSDVTVTNGTVGDGTGTYAVQIWASGDDDDPTTFVLDDSATVTAGTYALCIYGDTGSSSHEGAGFDVTINGSVIATNEASAGIWIQGNMQNTEADVCNLTINGTVEAGSDGVGIACNGVGNVTVNEDAEISGGTGIEMRAGTLEVNGGTITGTGAEYDEWASSNGNTTCGAGIAISEHVTDMGVTVTINDGNISGCYAVKGTDVQGTELDDVTVSITGGTFASTNTEDYAALDFADGMTVVISGGMYNTEITEDSWIVEGYEEIEWEIAGTPWWSVEQIYVASIGDQKFTTVADAVAAAQDGDTITLLRDVDENVVIDNGLEVTLDLNGYTLAASSGYTLTVSGGADVTVTNGTIGSSDTTYAVQVWASGNDSDPTTFVVDDDAIVTSNTYALCIYGDTGSTSHEGAGFDVTINGSVIATNEASAGIWIQGNMQNTDADVCDLTINGTVEAGSDGVGIACNGVGNVTVNTGAEISGGTGIEMRAGTLEVNGGTITGTGAEYDEWASSNGNTTCGAGIAISEHVTDMGVTVTINDGNISGCYAVKGTDVQGTEPDDVTITITGGSFTSTNTDEYAAIDFAEGMTVEISGGTYNTDTFGTDDEWVVTDFEVVDNQNGTWSVIELAVAAINGVTYPSVAAALAAAEDGDTITLLCDWSENVVIDGQNVTLDLGGYTLTAEDSEGPALIVSGSADVTVTNGTIGSGDIDRAVYVYASGDDDNPTKFTLEDGATLTGAKNGLVVYGDTGAASYDGHGFDITINGTVTSDDSAIWINGYLGRYDGDEQSDCCSLTIGSTGKVTGGDDATDSGIGIAGWADVTIEGGAEVSGGTGIMVRAGSLTVEDGCTISGTYEGFVEGSGNGVTASGAGIAVDQHAYGNSVTVEINGGEISGYYALAVDHSYANTDYDVTITVTSNDATFCTTNEAADAAAVYVSDDVLSNPNYEPFLSAGTYNTDVDEAYIVVGDKTFDHHDGWWTIERAYISEGDVSGIDPSYEYTGSQIAPVPVVTVDGKTLEEGVDYEVTYGENTEIGTTGTVTITGIGNYEGEVVVEFEITAIQLTEAMFDVDTSYEIYDGENPCTKDIIGHNGDVALVEGTDYTVAYADNDKTGTATITITGIGNYTGELTYEFQVIHYFLDVWPYGANYNWWFFDAVYDMAAEGVITGYGPDYLYFGVGDALTRADMITIMWRYCEPEEYKNYDQATAKNETDLPDVPDGAYYTGAVNWGVENGVITGHLLDDGSYIYAPDDPISFEQMILITARAVLGSVEAASDYPTTALDNSMMIDKDTVSDWARGAMSWAVENYLVTGNYHNDGTYTIDPLTNTARERMITVFARAVHAGLLVQD